MKGFLQQSWIQKIQGEYVLPVARVAYLAIAGASLLAVVIGIIFAGILQVSASRSTEARPVPDVQPPPAVAINLDTISNGFLPPSNIRAITLPFSRPASVDTPLLYLDADSPHGLAPYPDDFFILGGPDAQLIERVPINVGGRLHTGFKPTATLVEELNGVHPTRQYTIRIAAKDAGGSVSQPAILHFALIPTTTPATAAPPGPPPATSLETLARQIALFVDPGRSPVYFDAYQRALHEPIDCGTTANDANFVSEYQRAFTYMRPKLNKDAIENFYKELCNAWSAGISAQQLSMQQAEASHDQAIAQSLADQVQAEAQVFASRITRNATLLFVAGAMGLFLLLSLFLAFLAMENHSKAVREALAVLAAQREKP